MAEEIRVVRASAKTRLRRRLRFLRTRARELKMIGKALVSTKHPILVHTTPIRRRGMIAGLITNGFYLNRERIERLNEAGLEHVQISIDNVAPDEVSKKSL